MEYEQFCFRTQYAYTLSSFRDGLLHDCIRRIDQILLHRPAGFAGIVPRH